MLLVISIPDSAKISANFDDAASWALFDVKGNPLREGYDHLHEMPRAEQVIALVPASRIAFIETPLPRVSGAKREALLRYAIEDKLTIDPDTIHAVLLGAADTVKSDALKSSAGKSGAGHVAQDAVRYIVAAIDRRWFAAAISWLTAANMTPRAAFAATECVSAAEGEWAIVLSPQQSYAKRHDGFAYALDSSAAAIGSSPSIEPPFALSLALNENMLRPTTLAIYNGSGIDSGSDSNSEITPSTKQALLEHWQAKLGIDCRIAGGTALMQAGKRLLQLKNSNHNLLTGEFKPRSAAFGWVTLLRPALFFFAAIIALQIILSIADAWRLDRKRIALETQMRQIFQTAFPKATAIVDPALQLQRNLETLKRERGLSSGSDPRRILAKLTALSKAAPMLVFDDITIDEKSTTVIGSLNVAITNTAANTAANAAATDEALLRKMVEQIQDATITIDAVENSADKKITIVIPAKAGE